MITTRFGSQITILSVDSTGTWARVQRVEDGALREWRISDLRSDTIEELENALKAMPVYTYVRS